MVPMVLWVLQNDERLLYNHIKQLMELMLLLQKKLLQINWAEHGMIVMKRIFSQ
jgi:hypothetical protein